MAAKKPPRRRRHEAPPAPATKVPPARRAHPVPDVTSDPDRYDEARHAFAQRLPITRATWDTLEAKERKFAFMVSAVAHADMVMDVFDAIERALRDGTGLEEFKVAVEEKLTKEWGGEIPGRVETIFRTNVQTAYNEGRYSVYSAPAVREARPFFRFDAIDDDRTDDECADLDGLVLEQDDPFWDTHHPPLHFNCRCLLTGLSKAEADDEGVDRAPQSEHADEGFGERPETRGTDWSPDFSKYPETIERELRFKLGD